MYLSYNRLTGEIPLELGALANLRWLYLAGNELTGCIPSGFGDVRNNDLEQLGLPFCDDEIEQSDCSTGSAVPDAANNPGLVSDCEALLASRDTLAGDRDPQLVGGYSDRGLGRHHLGRDAAARDQVEFL